MSGIAQFESRIASDSESLANRIARFETHLKSENNKALTVIRTVFGLAIRIVWFEIAANRWRFELLQTAIAAIQDIEGRKMHLFLQVVLRIMNGSLCLDHPFDCKLRADWSRLGLTSSEEVCVCGCPPTDPTGWISLSSPDQPIPHRQAPPPKSSLRFCLSGLWKVQEWKNWPGPV